MPQPSRFPARPLDVVWLLLYAALALAGPIRSTAAIEVLVGLAALQLIEPRLPWFTTREGTVALVMLKLFLAWLLIGVTDGIASSYYLILMVPVVAAATALGAVGTMLVSLLASVSYLSFLLFIDWESQNIQPDQMREIALRILLFCILAVLMYQLADASRAQARQYKETAGQLAEAYRNLEAAEAAVRRSERACRAGSVDGGPCARAAESAGHHEGLGRSAHQESRTGPDHSAGSGRLHSRRSRSHEFFGDALPRLRPSAATYPDGLGLERDAGPRHRRLQNQQPPLPVAVSIIRNYSPDIRPFPFDADLMELVFYNLLLNAAQAGLPGCSPITITVKTRAHTGRRRGVRDRPWRRDRSGAAREYFQPVLYDETNRNRARPFHCRQDRRRAWR
jgi:hypothetical protein